MKPRGRRIPWWSDPKHPPRLLGRPVGNATEDAVRADEALLRLPGAASEDAPANEGEGPTQTARKARRRRRDNNEVKADDF